MAVPQDVPIVRIDNCGREEQKVRAIARPRCRRRICWWSAVTSRRTTNITEILGETLALGLVPALCLGLAAGAFLSIRAQKRIDEVNA